MFTRLCCSKHLALGLLGLLLWGSAFAQERSISGTVTSGGDATSLPGVNVIVQGTSKGTTTDANGKYVLTLSAGENQLVFTFVGYKTQIVDVANRNTIDVVMEEDLTALDEVVVVAFGEQKKANLTGAVTSIDAETLRSRPLQNTTQMLQGVMPGLNIQSSGLGGELNGGLSINIRGTGTIGSGSSASPLILVDGVEANINSLNPQDIESITVLKDAAASAVYGSRASFGVVLITTKSGVAGAPKVNYNNNFRFTSPLNLPEMMDSHTFARYFNEAAINSGQSPVFSQEVLDRIVQYQNGEIDYATVPNGNKYAYYGGSHANTDWFEEQYKDHAFSHDHNLSVSGGSDKITYYASSNYLDQAGLSAHSGDHFNRYSLTGKINAKVSDRVSFNYTNRFIREDYTKATHQNDLFYHNIARRWPTVPVKDPNGFYSDPSEIAQLRDGGRTNDQTDQLFMQGQLVINPIEKWNIYIGGNYRVSNRNYHSDVLPAFGHDINGDPYPLSVYWNSAGYTSVYEFNNKNDFYTSNVYSDYEFDLDASHHFKVMAGFNSELNKYRTIGASKNGLITPQVPTLNTAIGENVSATGEYQHWATAGFFGRINYNFKDKYLLEVNGRYDGTSRFLEDQRWNFFPSVSAGWNVANEDFWTWGNVVQLFKLRASYGELGNQGTNNWYPFYQSMPISTNNGGWLINGERTNTAYAPGLISTLMTWERVTSWNFGVDLALVDHKLNINLDYFERKTLDMVGPAPELPVILGTSVPMLNNADMRSYGFELEMSWRDRIGDFNYNIRGVLSDDQQEITRYPNETNNISNWYVGRRMGEIWGYTTVGIASTDEEMLKHLETADQTAIGSNWQAGDIMYADLNGDGKINGGSGVLDDTGDRKILGNSTLRFRYGVDLTGSYRNFDLRIFLQGVGKRDWMPNGPYFWGANGGQWQSAGFVEHMDFFRDAESPMVQAGVADVNMDPYYPRPYFSTGKNQNTQSRYVQSAAYLRVKNVQLGYTLPAKVASIARLSSVRLYVSGENLATFSKLSKVFDPESVGLSGWNDGKTYPYSMVLSFGLNVNF